MAYKVDNVYFMLNSENGNIKPSLKHVCTYVYNISPLQNAIMDTIMYHNHINA